MNYVKPTVIIDLDEYNDLKDKVKSIQSDKPLHQAKQVIATLLNSGMNLKNAYEDLKKHGISFSVEYLGMSNDVINPENIFIKSLK